MSRKVVCPSCATVVNLGEEPRLQQQVTCKVCGAVSEVVGLEPFELDWPIVKKLRQDTEYGRPYPNPLYDY